MVTVDERLTSRETEFRTELRHLATKADLAYLKVALMLTIIGAGAASASVVVAVLRLWQ